MCRMGGPQMRDASASAGGIERGVRISTKRRASINAAEPTRIALDPDFGGIVSDMPFFQLASHKKTTRCWFSRAWASKPSTSAKS